MEAVWISGGGGGEGEGGEKVASQGDGSVHAVARGILLRPRSLLQTTLEFGQFGQITATEIITVRVLPFYF